MGKIFDALKKAGYENSGFLARSGEQPQKGKSVDYNISKSAKTKNREGIKTGSQQQEPQIKQHIMESAEIIDYSDALGKVRPDEPKVSLQVMKTILSDSMTTITRWLTGWFKANVGEPVKALNDETNTELVLMAQPDSFAADQFKALRTNLLFPLKGPKARFILVTSALPGEGKSFVSANLSVSIAQNINDHVLLIDCDLRRPRLHKIFGLGNVMGLSDYLTNGNNISSIIYPTTLEKLTIIPGGNIPPNPSELLSSEKMSDLLAEVKTRYADHLIIIDSPPPLLTAETMALSRQIDGILIVIKAGSTKREMIEKVVESLEKKKILGFVLNNYEMGLSGYYKSYKKIYSSKSDPLTMK